MSKQLRLLPQGLQVFEKIREMDAVYVDKTEPIYQLLQRFTGTYFLSRPRRFGKSLLISTLEALFQGRKELFEGLWIADSDYSWESFPVIRLDFSDLNTSSPEALEGALNRLIFSTAKWLGTDIELMPTPSETLDYLIRVLSAQGKPVILVDEYDAPLRDQLHNPELSRANRDVVAKFFATFKKLQSKVHFAFITGVSQFAKVSLFSGLNNLIDLSFDPTYATLLGWTEQEIRFYLKPHVELFAEKRNCTYEQAIERLRYWYNGYRFFHDSEAVFNPWSVICTLSSTRLKNYWFASGNPSLVVQKLRKNQWTTSKLQSDIVASSDLEDPCDPFSLDVVPLLYQTGYLTISGQDPTTENYFLRIPNEEVRQSLIQHLLMASSTVNASKFAGFRQTFKESLDENDLERLFATFNELLASISYQLHSPDEKYYHSLLHMCLASLGFSVDAEVSTNQGRLDMVIEMPERLFILEFKIDKSPKSAIKQIHASRYPERYKHLGKPIELVGVRFSSKQRRVDDWTHEQLADE